MKRGQRKAVSPSGGIEQHSASSKPNRLSRSYRASQQSQVPAQTEPPRSQQFDFKTPTRTSRPRSVLFRSSSPHNDSDCQQDIVWDATSPSPHRLGKRGRRQPARPVDISEMVTRIAPKHGRPEAAETLLQQWIGDSAAIPCTPEVSRPRKSPRSDGVHDLLRLAKEFDFLFQEQEEQQEEQELLLSQDIFDPHADPAEGAELPVDEDLDFLFDGATQQVGGALSPPPPGPDSSSFCCSSSSAAGVQGTLARDGWEDDWGDDLLSDSLLLEATQNPDKISSPRFCSTQKPAGGAEPSRGDGPQPPPGTRWDSGPAFPVQKSLDTRQNQVLSARAVGPVWTRPAGSDQNLVPASRKPAGEPVWEDQVWEDQVWEDQVWEDPADDQLLCDLCEDLEKQLQERRSSGPHRAALQPASRNLLTPPSPAAVTAQTGFQSGPRRSSQHSQFPFKKPAQPTRGGGGPPVPAAPPCSAAQIEEKKQLALQRRRRRLQLAQGLGPGPQLGPPP